MVGDQLIPVPCRVHRWLRDVAKERPARPHRGIEDRSNPLGILSERAAHRELARGGLGSLHTIEHAREPTRADLRQPTTAADAHDPATCPRHPHGVDRGHSLGVVAEPEYPRITDVHEQPTTTGGRITLTGPMCSSRMYPTIAIGWANSLSGAGCCSSTDSSTPRNIRPRRRPPSSSASTTPGAGRLTAERSHPTTAASPIYVGANRTARCLPIYRGTITPTSAWHQDTGCCAPCPWRALALGHVELQGVQPADDLLRSQPRRTHRADEVTLAECRRRDL